MMMMMMMMTLEEVRPTVVRGLVGHEKQSVTTEVACSVGKLHVHTVDDSVQYIEHKRKT